MKENMDYEKKMIEAQKNGNKAYIALLKKDKKELENKRKETKKEV